NSAAIAAAKTRLINAWARQRSSVSALRGRPDPRDHHAAIAARIAAGSTMTDVSFVAMARPAAAPATIHHARPPPVAIRPTATTNASVKHANSVSWMNIRE